MSAFTESPINIAIVAAFAAETIAAAAPLAETLARQNIRSVASLYGEARAAEMAGHPNVETYVEACRSEAVAVFMRGTENLNPYAVHRIAKSVRYQSCETVGYNDSPPARIVRSVIDATPAPAPTF